MKHLKFVALVVMLLLVAVVPVAAQENTDTITVTGFGSAFGTPDMARLDIGVEVTGEDIATTFEEANRTIDEIIAVMVDAGVAREDIRTVNLNVFLDRFGGPQPTMSPETGQPVPSYVVNNMVNVVIRDIELVEEVITAAVEAGATNIFGLNFSIADTGALESEARQEAIADAEERAQELADLVGAELGAVVTVIEGGGGGVFPPFAESAMGMGGVGGGATIEPGQLSVSMSVQVTYTINR